VTATDPDRPEERRSGVPRSPLPGPSARTTTRSTGCCWCRSLLTLFPPIYNSIDPTIGDVPFFYWYQMAAIVVSVVVTLLVYRKTRA
jgi:hypothetical protein